MIVVWGQWGMQCIEMLVIIIITIIVILFSLFSYSHLAISDLGFWKLSPTVVLLCVPSCLPHARVKDKHPPLGSFLLFVSLPGSSSHLRKCSLFSLLSLSFSHPSPSLSPPSPFPLRRKAQCSLIDSSACSQRPEHLSWAGPVMGPEDSAWRKPNIHFNVTQLSDRPKGRCIIDSEENHVWTKHCVRWCAGAVGPEVRGPLKSWIKDFLHMSMLIYVCTAYRKKITQNARETSNCICLRGKELRNWEELLVNCVNLGLGQCTFKMDLNKMHVKKRNKKKDCSGGPVVKTLSFPCRGHRFNPRSGN